MYKKLNYTDYAQPIYYEVLPNKYSAEHILKILLDPTISSSVICTVRPLEITKSATYVVDIHSLTHPMTSRMITSGSGNIQGRIRYILGK